MLIQGPFFASRAFIMSPPFTIGLISHTSCRSF
jgi:hypothetical protein